MFTDENLHGDKNLNATSEIERLQYSNPDTSELSSLENTKELVPDSKYHYLFQSYLLQNE
jgi:hypothetical protein